MLNNPVMLNFSSACKFFLSRKNDLMRWPFTQCGKRDFKRVIHSIYNTNVNFSQEKVYWRKNLRMCRDIFGFLRSIREVLQIRQKELLHIISKKLAAFLAQKGASLVMACRKTLLIYFMSYMHKMLQF